MGLLAGGANFVEFQVSGDLPDDPLGFMAERVKAFSFQDIDETYDEYSIGWASVLDMFDSAVATHLNSDYVVMSLRIDERKIPGAVLNKFFEKECRREMAEKQIPKLSRASKVQIKERIRTEFMRKAKPTPTVVNLAWDLSGNHLLFFSTNKKAQALLEDFFKESFGLTLRQNIPYLLAESFPSVAGLDKITQTIFA